MDANGYAPYTSHYNFTLIFRLKFQFAKVFQFRRGTPLAFEKSASKIPKNESLASRYGGNFTFVHVPSCDHFIDGVMLKQ